MTEPAVEMILGVRLIRPEVHVDSRGFFVELFRRETLAVPFVQANHSRSLAGTLRGLHYHLRQADAWHVVSGRAQVALADLRSRLPDPPVVTFELAAEEPAVLYIPAGVAHGFLALTDLDLIYWVTELYDGSDEFRVAWNDPTLEVPWATAEPTLSPQDAAAPRLSLRRRVVPSSHGEGSS